jgi:hypothetical protein
VAASFHLPGWKFRGKVNLCYKEGMIQGVYNEMPDFIIFSGSKD